MNTRKGFTLVELLVVIAILAILASVAVVGYTAFIDKADQSKVDAEIKQVVNILNAEYAEEGTVDEATITAFIEGNADLQGLEGTITVTVVAGENVTVTYTIDDATATSALLVKGAAVVAP